MRLDVFQILVEQYGVRTFALEGDFGGCDAVNRYIHGGEGTAAESISGHNNHIMQCQNAGTPVLGSLLAEKLGEGYFAIGTDFYKSVCNLPKPYTGKLPTYELYSK